MRVVYTIWVTEFNIKRKKSARRFMYAPWALATLFIMTIFIARAAWNVHEKQVTSAEALDRSAREYAKLLDRKNSLASAVISLETPQGVETEIRQKFRVAKDGEELAVILEDAPSSTATTTTLHRTFWYKLLHLFSSE